MLALKRMIKIGDGDYDVTIMQTPNYGESKGYVPVFRLTIEGGSHAEVVNKIYKKFNVTDSIPKAYSGRFIATGDIIMIDEGTLGISYYRLEFGGWKKINRVAIR
ncbi:hypothetical protein [Sutcliffiella rhizosphaerae]|uniref:YodL-like protein n=1 Tax=Sutcliffiella rhizosphaerae TaxID=2880967 RepID=A0ABM8YPK0_9BACI|nr:hypothetical protein [Sutcliffiella rhizosphaerae]CAG9621954.1 hypothetical protein BACCIP111883_02745 [Sutcliffiella rhizosphaerae]